METKNLDTKYCVGLGEILFDVLPTGSQLGGAPANFAYHAGQHGLHSVAVSAVGKDVLGDTALRLLDEKKLKYVMPEVEFPTGTVQVQLDKEGVPTYDIKQNVAWDNIPFTDDIKEIAANAGAVCWGSLAQRSEVSRKTIYTFLDHTPEDCLITIGRLFGYPGLDIENKCWLILGKYNLDMLVLTCGVNGSYVFAPGVKSFQETPKVEVADTVGAGDSFTGTFCASILKGKSIQEAHELAVKVSAYVCTQNGAMPQIPEEYTL